MFGPFGPKGGPLGTGQRTVTAQASGMVTGSAVNLPAQAVSGERLNDPQKQALPGGPPASRLAAIEEREELNEAGWAARARALPAVDPRVLAGPPPLAAEATVPRGALRPAASPGPMAPGDAVFFRTKQLIPPSGFGSAVGEPAVAQNGLGVLETFNWFGAVSFDGGNTVSYFDPSAFNGMTDFCCDQDMIYDKASDRSIWERLGIGGFACGAGCTQNRTLLTIVASDFNTLNCTYDLRGTSFGLNNAFLDYPRMALSDKFLYIQWNIFDWTSGAYVTHLLVRANLDTLNSCAGFTGTVWNFSAGWSPTLVENAKEVMYMGDQIITNTGLNDQFRVYWIFDDQTSLNFVDRTMTNPFLFTQGNAVCTVPGGANPCARADHRITGAAVLHNSPIPGGLGPAADKVDFFWNVRQGNGFPFPFVESIGFHGGTVLEVQRRLIWNPSFTFFYAAAGANDRQHEGISVMAFFPSGTQPQNYVGLDDDYNGNPPGWEVYATFTSTGNWTTSASGDYLRLRMHSPVGAGWIATGYTSTGSANNYRPNYVVFGRARDTAGFNRFDQK
jgi:hypothetical protein